MQEREQQLERGGKTWKGTLGGGGRGEAAGQLGKFWKVTDLGKKRVFYFADGVARFDH